MRDYNLSLKLQFVKEFESGEQSAHFARRKYVNFNCEKHTPSNMAKRPEQRII